MPDLYVSPTGSGDEYSLGSPGSLHGAIKKVRTLTGTMSEDITIYLRGGTYFLDEPMVLWDADSGKNGHRVIYKAYTGESPVLSGGVVITGWSSVGGGVYKASYTGPGFRQLYVDGSRAVKARKPTQTDDLTFGPYYEYVGWDGDNKCVKVNTSEISSWTGLQDVEMVVKHHWNQGRYRIDHITVDGADSDFTWVYFREPETSINAWESTSTHGSGWISGQTFYFENSIDILDAEGEWFFDRSAGEVYYYPRSGEDMGTAGVIAPARDLLLEVDGASYISFEDLIIEHSNWDLPHDARIGRTMGLRRGYPRIFIPGGIRVVRSHHIWFLNNVIRNFGGIGIELSHSTHENIIDGNTITNIASNGIVVYTRTYDSNPTASKECRADEITNNTISKVAQEYTGGAGINATFVNSIVIEHNEISDTPYAGINVGAGFSDTTTNLQDNSVQYNHVHHVMQLHDDGGGIYANAKQSGTVFSYNYVHDIVRSEWAEAWAMGAFYLDNGSSYMAVENNVIGVAPRAFSAWNQPNHDNTFRYNWYDENDEILSAEENTVSDNVLVAGEGWPAGALAIIAAAGPES